MLKERRQSRSGKLSGGMQRMVELGRHRFEGPVEEVTDLKKAFWV